MTEPRKTPESSSTTQQPTKVRDDRLQRNPQGADDAPEDDDEKIDETLEQTFPASDPPAVDKAKT